MIDKDELHRHSEGQPNRVSHPALNDTLPYSETFEKNEPGPKKFRTTKGNETNLPEETGTSAIPSLLNSVYSIHVMAYSIKPSPLLCSVRTLTPSAAPTLRRQDANPNFCTTITRLRYYWQGHHMVRSTWSSIWSREITLLFLSPMPDKANKVVSTPAIGLLPQCNRP